MFRFRYFPFFFVLLSFLWVGFADESGPTQPTDMLERAWEEYRFLSLDQAKSYFNQVLSKEEGTSRGLEAKLGLAMIRQYAESGSDLTGAEAMYKEILAAGPETEVADLVRSNLADLHISRGEKDAALALLDQLIEERLHSVIGQDALLRKVVLVMGEFGSEQSVAAAREAEEKLSEVEVSTDRPLLVPILSSLLGDIYFRADVIESAVAHYERYTTIGSAHSTNYASQASQLYRLANIYENTLNQPDKAGHFYRRLATEYSNSQMAYYALEKAILYNAITRDEVRELRLGGVTDEILDELFAVKGERN
ncbi:MAG: tetratricopeptide repeat protein [Kiritimatiellia bacterium]